MAGAFIALLPLAIHAQPRLAPPAKPEVVKIGIYVLRLSDLNPSTQSFSADFWVWTLSSASSNSCPIKTVGLENAKQFWASEPKEEIVGDRRWGYREFNATIGYDWAMHRFPFDKHTLEIAVGETDHDTRSITYEADKTDSGTSRNIQLTDWGLKPGLLTTGGYPYDSRFGDITVPIPRTYWAEAHLTIPITRKDRGLSFFKLVFTAYVAFAIMLLSFLMGKGEFSSRISLLLGALFATVVSMRTSAAALGDTPRFTLVEHIHLLVVGYILFSALVALLTYYAEEQRATSRRINITVALTTTATFIVWNLYLLAKALRL
ncbi:MAG: hypothetical protein QOC81_1573 [Thermoanaerobaculia bacterium]|jgi:hypothetical protein|nr:hypothetical protein [Thermoanaerobaculia bacterium]